MKFITIFSLEGVSMYERRVKYLNRLRPRRISDVGELNTIKTNIILAC